MYAEEGEATQFTACAIVRNVVQAKATQFTACTIVQNVVQAKATEFTACTIVRNVVQAKGKLKDNDPIQRTVPSRHSKQSDPKTSDP